ncbi:MAG: thiamine-phosphate kinase, partial [Elusimicrobiota bacterium]|nr:thiamine-phosphate kinase [Elusimicrobiota bacterium]
DIGEFKLIENIKSWIRLKDKTKKCNKNVIGIGDDAAIIKVDPNFKNILASIDTLVEGTHFTRETTNFYELGWKSLAVNISDIAAMGGIAKYALISIACPEFLKIEDLKKFYFGFQELANIADIKLIGGDTVKSDKKIVVSISIIGHSLGNNYFLRCGIESGDYVFSTGTFGDAAMGLRQLLKEKKTKKYFRDRFNKPMPRFEEAKILGQQNLATAMIDVSDGLAFSLNELANKNKKGILIYADKIPISTYLKNEILSQKIRNFKSEKSYLDFALYGGEDYELLFCAKKSNTDEILNKCKNASIIGEVVNNFFGVKMIDKNNNISNISKEGYVAFKKN